MTDHTTDGSDRQTNPGYLHRRSDDFGKVPAELMHDLTLTDGAVRLYAHMHWRYGSNCTNFEGRASMAKYLGVSEATISHRVAELVAANWIVVVGQTNKKGRATNFYHVFEVKAECQKWRELHPEAQAKPEPKQPKEGEEPGRKLRRGIGGRPLHKPKDDAPGNETQVKNTTGQLVNLGSQTNVNSSSHDPESVYPDSEKYLSASPVASAPSAPVVIASQTREPQRETAIVALMESIASQPESPAIEDEEPHANGKEVLPPPPDGFIWIESSVSTLQGTAHLAPRDAHLAKALCKTHLKHLGMLHPAATPCAACLALAAKPKRAPKPPKPAIYSDAALFEAIGAFSFGAKDAADLRAVAGRVGKIREALADYVCAKNGGAPDAERIAAVVARVKELPDFYKVECKDCTPPATPDTFMTWYTKMLAKRGGNGNGTGVRYVWRGKEWPVYEGRVHVEIMPNVHRNIPASAAYWQSFLEEMEREEKHRATVARN